MIPVFRPRLSAPPERLQQTLLSDWWGTGPRVEEFEQEFAKSIGLSATRCLMVNSCTAALHLAVALYPDAQRFIVPALTFISTALAPRYEKKQVIFAEVGEDLCIDQDDVLQRVVDRTDVVIAVHLGGHVASLDKLRELRVIEDCAHALGSVGIYGHVGSQNAGCFSFQATKGCPIGDGGMLVLPTEAPRAETEARAWCGIEGDTWSRSQEGYRWAYKVNALGYKYRANDVLASLALDQWSGVVTAIAERVRLAERYSDALSDLAWLRLPQVRAGTKPNWQEYIVRTEKRDALHEHLAARGIASTVHYYPVNLYSPFFMYDDGAVVPQPLPHTESIWREVLTIPCFAGLTEEEQEQVIAGIRSFCP